MVTPRYLAADTLSSSIALRNIRGDWNNAGVNAIKKFFILRLFDLILYVPSTIFQLNRDGSSWVEPVLS